MSLDCDVAAGAAVPAAAATASLGQDLVLRRKGAGGPAVRPS